MGRLIAFGCSCTYGQCLPDCQGGPDPMLPPGHFKPGPNASTMAWPSIAAGNLGMDCVNNGLPGNTNINIAMAILSWDWQTGDRAAVLWTYPDRDTIYTDDGNRDHLHAFMVDVPHNERARSFYAAHDIRDLQLRSWMHQDLSARYLASRGVRFAMASISHWTRHGYPGEDHRHISSDNFDCEWIDRASDELHPGPRQQAIWGQLFANRLRYG